MPKPYPTERFSSRVEHYIRFRPGYPPAVIELLQNKCELTPTSVVADIGSGTGILTRMFLDNGNRVFAVEPNLDMRKAGEEFLRRYPGYISVAGSAEATTLADHSIDLLAAGQAAHWFDREKARREFVRILKPGGWVALVWNERLTDTTPFLREYEQLLLAYGTDYQDVRHERTTSAIAGFFAPSPYQEGVFENQQEFDYEALKGRLLSSSYTPQPDHPNYEPMLRELRRIFDEHESSGQVLFEYSTRVFYGQLS
jgi:SAM-dependent methyltransferase